MHEVKAILLACFLALVCSANVFGANVTLTAPDADGRRYVRIEGEILKGDTDKVRSIVAKADGVDGYELNSPGGDFAEGLKLALLFRGQHLSTIIRRNDACKSACAIAFLGGSDEIDEGTVPFRLLEVGGKLEFHAPYVEIGQKTVNVTELVSAITTVNIDLTTRFQDFGVVKSLVPKLMKNEPDHSLFDATEVEVISSLGVSVQGWEPIERTITPSMIENICSNGWVLSKNQLPSAPEGYETLRHAFGRVGDRRFGGSNSSQTIHSMKLAEGDLLVGLLSQNDYEGSTMFCGVNKDGSAFACEVVDGKLGKKESCTTLAWETDGFLLMVPPHTKLTDVENVLADYRRNEQDVFKNLPSVQPQPLQVPEDEASESREMVVCNPKSTISNVRSGPNSKLFPILLTLSNHDAVTVLGRQNNPETGHPWAIIEVDGAQGYIDSDWLAFKCESSALTAPTAQAVICNHDASITNLRAGPNSQMFGVIAALGNNTAVRILSHTNNPLTGHPWFEVTVNGLHGFVDAEKVSKTGCAVGNSNPTRAVICNRDADITNMRSGPNSEKFAVIAVLRNGKSVEVIEASSNPVTGHPWLRVRTGNIIGYVDSEKVAAGC